MLLLHGLKRVRIGKKFLFFGGDTYYIKPVTVLDVLGEAEGLPMCFLKKQEYAGSAYEKVKALQKQTEEEHSQMLKALRFFLSKGVVYKNGKKFDVDTLLASEFSDNTMNKILRLFWNIINISFKLFREQVDITTLNINAIYVLSSKYGCRPIDIIANKSNYTDLDAWMFDMFVSGHGIHEEERQIKQQNRRQRRGK